MITLGINFLLISALVLVVGMIKPNWILFFMDKPPRMGVLMLASVVFMAGATFFGEGVKEKKAQKAMMAKQQQTEQQQTNEKSASASVLEENRKEQ